MKKNITLLSLTVAAILSGCASKGDASHNPGGNVDLSAALRAEKAMFPPPNSLSYVVSVDAPMAKIGSEVTKANVIKAANIVADWQIKHQDDFLNSDLRTFQGTKRYSYGGWLMGTMAIGMTKWGQIEGNEKYLEFAFEQAEQANHKVEVRTYDADDYTIGQSYLTLAEVNPKRVNLKPLQERLDYIYKTWPTVNKEVHPSCYTLEQKCRERWTWIDALFMGGPVWYHMAKQTGDNKYAEFADKEYWDPIEKFLDKEEGLLYRDSRFIGVPDGYGKKIFWSRGNGWVMASIPRILDNMPEDSARRAKFEDLMKTMAVALKDAQQADGSWHPSLQHPERYNMKENSGSAFFAYGLAWGINNGVLDKATYQPVVEKAWQSIAASIYADGRLGYVQPSGYDPRWVRSEDTDVYGVGAFLLASSEIIKLAK